MVLQPKTEVIKRVANTKYAFISNDMDYDKIWIKIRRIIR